VVKTWLELAAGGLGPARSTTKPFFRIRSAAQQQDNSPPPHALGVGRVEGWRKINRKDLVRRGWGGREKRLTRGAPGDTPLGTLV